MILIEYFECNDKLELLKKVREWIETLNVTKTEYYKDNKHKIPPVARSNADYALAEQMNKASVDILAEEYLFGSFDKREFIKIYAKSTSYHGFSYQQ